MYICQTVVQCFIHCTCCNVHRLCSHMPIVSCTCDIDKQLHVDDLILNIFNFNLKLINLKELHLKSLSDVLSNNAQTRMVQKRHLRHKRKLVVGRTSYRICGMLSRLGERRIVKLFVSGTTKGSKTRVL